MNANSRKDGYIPTSVIDDIIKLVEAMDNVIQNFNSIKKPIIDSSNSVPKATEQLDKVTQETEKATSRMLDLVEGITDKEIETLSIVGDLLENSDGLNDGEKDKLQKVRQNAENVQNDTFLIMDSLQFQDITTQQIHHANSILEALEDEMRSLVEVMGKAIKSEQKSRSFDPNATIEGGETRQQNVDELIKSIKQDS